MPLLKSYFKIGCSDILGIEYILLYSELTSEKDSLLNSWIMSSSDP